MCETCEVFSLFSIKTETWILVVIFIAVVWACLRREKKETFTHRRNVERFTREDDLVRGLLQGRVKSKPHRVSARENFTRLTSH